MSFEFSHMAVPQIFPVLHLLRRGQECTSWTLALGWGHMTMMHLWVEAMCHFWDKHLIASKRLSRASVSLVLVAWQHSICKLPCHLASGKEGSVEQVLRRRNWEPDREMDPVAHSRDDLINIQFYSVIFIKPVLNNLKKMLLPFIGHKI